MGVLSYLVAADARLPERASGLTYQKLAIIGHDVKGLDTIMLGTLYAIALEREYDADFLNDQEHCKWNGGHDGPWLFDCSDDFVVAINGIGDNRVGAIYDRWRKTEEFNMPISPYPDEAVRFYFDTIRTECARAKENGWKLYLYISM